MNHLYTIAKAVMQLVFVAFICLVTLAVFDAVTAEEAKFAMLAMLIAASHCVVIFEIRLQRSKQARG